MNPSPNRPSLDSTARPENTLPDLHARGLYSGLMLFRLHEHFALHDTLTRSEFSRLELQTINDVVGRAEATASMSA